MATSENVTSTLAAAQPFYLRGGEHAVLLIHGFTGSPNDMRFLGTNLHAAGFTVSCPRLPGHGTDGNDFLTTTERDWERRILDAYYDLKGQHDTVSVCGLSMGGVLSVILAARVPISSVILAAPAILVRNKLVPFARFIGPFVKRQRIEPQNTYDDQPEIRRLVDEYWSWQWNLPVARLYRLIKRARRSLPAVTAPTLTVVSEVDRLVPPEVARYVADRIGSYVHEEHMLHNSNHVVTNDCEREQFARLTSAWLTRTHHQ